MSREVSPELSAYIVTLLERERPRFKSQNKMAEEISIPGGTLSTIVTQTKGIGADILPKFLTFFGKTRKQLEAEAKLSASHHGPAGIRVYTSDPELAELRDAAVEELVREGVGLRKAERAIDGVAVFKHGEQLPTAKEWARLGHSLVLAEAAGKQVGVSPSAPFDPSSPRPPGGGAPQSAHTSLKVKSETRKLSERPSDRGRSKDARK